MTHLAVVALLLAATACVMVSGEIIGKNSLTCITFDKPYFDWRGRFTASQGIWLKNVQVLRELNCGLDRACGRFHAPSRLEIPFFNNNDFFDFSVSVWFKREGGTGCSPVLVSNGDCAQRTFQISSTNNSLLTVTVRPSEGLAYEETFVTEPQSAAWRHVVVTVHVDKWLLKGWTKVYIDGKLVGKGHLNGKMQHTSFPMFIGSNACGPCKFNYFNGLMDSISFSRYALRSSEVYELYLSRGLCIGLPGEMQWALIVAGSNTYWNYRHQADACHAYQIVKKNGIPEERIVLMMYDDIAYNDDNPYPGAVFNRPDGPNVYDGVRIDYRQNDVTAENFLNVLSGNQAAMAWIGSGRVINSGMNDNVFVFYSNHGGPEILPFPTGGVLHAKRLNAAIKSMYDEKKYKEMVFYIEACHSGSMFESILPSNISVYATTAAFPNESSYACYHSTKTGAYLGDEFSVNWMEDSDAGTVNETVNTQFEIVKAATSDSHVQEYGQKSVSQNLLSAFQGPNHGTSKRRRRRSVRHPDAVPQIDAPLQMLHIKLNASKNSTEIRKLTDKINAINRIREDIDDVFARIEQLASNNNQIVPRRLQNQTLGNFTCYEQAVDLFNEQCYSLSEYDYALHRIDKLANLCQEVNATDSVLRSIEDVCVQQPAVIN